MYQICVHRIAVQYSFSIPLMWASLIAQLVRNLPAMQDTWVPSLAWEDPLKRGRLPTPVFWPREFHGLHGVAKSWTGLSYFHFQCTQVLQSCLLISDSNFSDFCLLFSMGRGTSSLLIISKYRFQLLLIFFLLNFSDFCFVFNLP